MFNKQLTNPPIKEAIFGLVFQNDLPIEIIEQFCNSKYISEIFPSQKPQFGMVDRQHVEGKSTRELIKEGIILDCIENCGRLVKILKQSLSFHIVNKYENWEKLITEFKVICNELNNVSGLIAINKIYVRYINHIEIKVGDTMTEYFKLLPADVEGLPNIISDLFLQITLPYEDLIGIVTESIYRKDENSEFIIDLNVRKPFSGLVSDFHLWDAFQEVRKYKNKLFFSIITEKTINKFI